MATSQFDYMIPKKVRTELEKLGIVFGGVNAGGGEMWPGLLLPSKTLLIVSRDDEGNGPGAIHTHAVNDDGSYSERLSH